MLNLKAIRESLNAPHPPEAPALREILLQLIDDMETHPAEETERVELTDEALRDIGNRFGGPLPADPQELRRFAQNAAMTIEYLLSDLDNLRKPVEVEVAGIQTCVQLPQVEAVAAAVHEAWMAEKRAQGITSHISNSGTGEELMKPYKELSEVVQDSNRNLVRTVYSAIAWEGGAVELTIPAPPLEPTPPIQPLGSKAGNVGGSVTR